MLRHTITTDKAQDITDQTCKQNDWWISCMAGNG